MKTGRIWVLAVIFGIAASGSLYMYLMSNQKILPSVQVNSATKAETKVEATHMEQGNQIHTSPPVMEPSIQLPVSQGKRAISIEVNEEQGVSGFIVPGSFVDVIVMIPPPGGENASAQILLQNKKVLAVGRETNDFQSQTEAPKNSDEKDTKPEDITPGNHTYSTVTLEVLPIEGSSLALSQQRGEFHLMLRPEGDTTSSPQTHITLEQLNKGVVPR